jgi:hypothetical protein
MLPRSAMAMLRLWLIAFFERVASVGTLDASSEGLIMGLAFFKPTPCVGDNGCLTSASAHLDLPRRRNKAGDAGNTPMFIPQGCVLRPRGGREHISAAPHVRMLEHYQADDIDGAVHRSWEPLNRPHNGAGHDRYAADRLELFVVSGDARDAFGWKVYFVGVDVENGDGVWCQINESHCGLRVVDALSMSRGFVLWRSGNLYSASTPENVDLARQSQLFTLRFFQQRLSPFNLSPCRV